MNLEKKNGFLKGTLRKFLPFFSFSWGVFSSLSMSRGMHLAWRLEVVVLLFILCLIFLPKLILRLESWLEQRIALSESPNSAKKVGTISPRRGIFLEKANRVLRETLAPTLLQALQQYMLFFCIPFLYLSQAYFILFNVAVLAFSTLWDPWYFSLSKLVWYRRVLRCTCVVLAISFILGVETHFLLPYAYWIFLLTAFAVVFPTAIFRSACMNFGWHVKQLVAVVFVLGVASVSYFVGGIAKFPLLSFWVQPLESRISVVPDEGAPILGSVAEQRKLCCYSHVVAPRSLNIKISHRWYYDGRKIDEIALPPIRGNSEFSAYRTFSCKENFPQRSGAPSEPNLLNKLIFESNGFGFLAAQAGTLRCEVVAHFSSPWSLVESHYSLANLYAQY